MKSPQELEAVFLQNLPAAEKILSALARRHALTREEAEEFAAWAKLQIIKDDYAVLAKFRGESSLTTYLTVVFSMLYREYRVQEWGRWRPSAAALRGGPLAIRLEELVNRDGFALAHAGELLRTSGETHMSDRELARLLSELPRRTPARPVQLLDNSLDAQGPEHSDDLVETEESMTERQSAEHALGQALKALPEEDGLIVRMHFMERMTVADIARGLALPQKPLYRRLERALAILRTHLERAGVSRELVRDLSDSSQ